MRHRPIIPVTAAFAVGILAAESIAATACEWFWVALIALAVSSLLWRRRPGQRAVSVVLLVAVAVCAGAWHAYRREAGRSIQDFISPIGSIVRVRGTVLRDSVDKPADRFVASRRGTSAESAEGTSVYLMRATSILCGARWAPVSGRLRCRAAASGLGLRDGDRVEVLGTLTGLRPAANPGEVDFARYAARKGICGAVFSPVPENVRVIARGRGVGLRRCATWLRARVRQGLSPYLGQDELALTMSMLLGRRESLPQRLWDAFRHTGTLHFLAISGLHIGLMAGFLWFALLLCGVRPEVRACVVCAFLLGYGALVGWRPSVTRAVIMMCALFCAPLLRRAWDRWSAVGMAVLVILLVNPADLFSIGFHLSLAGVLGIMLLTPRLSGALLGDILWVDRLQAPEERSPWRRALPRGLARLLCVSLGAWVATAPLVAHHFHLFTPLVVLFNLVAGFMVWLILCAGMAVVVTAGFAAVVAAPVIQWSSRVLLELVANGERVPGCYFYVIGPSLLWVCVYYTVLGVWMMRERLCLRRRAAWAIVLLAANVYVLTHARHAAPDHPRVTFLAVQHGLSALVEFPDRRTLLYDAGSARYPAMGGNIVAPFLWASGLRRIDAVVLSHADADHYNGLPALAERVGIGSIITSECFRRSAAGEAVASTARKHRIPLLTAGTGDRVCLSPSGDIRVLNPPREGSAVDRLLSNDRSLVLRIECHGRSVLLTGDAETAAWALVRRRGEPRRADLLLVPHHGSLFEGYRSFVQGYADEVAVASNKAGTMSAAARAEWRGAGATLIETGEAGATRVTLAPDRVLVETWRGGRWQANSALQH